MTDDDSSYSNLQLPRVETRTLAHGRKRRMGMRLNLHLEGGQMTSDAKEYEIRKISDGVIDDCMLGFNQSNESKWETSKPLKIVSCNYFMLVGIY